MAKELKPTGQNLDINFFFEKILMRHHLRGATHAQPRRGKEKNDPTYVIVDSLTNTKMLTVDDILELKNPSARLAKAMVTIRNQKAKSDNKQAFQNATTVEDVENFMRAIKMWSQKELDRLHNTEGSGYEKAELEGETQALLKDKIFERIQSDPKYNQAFEIAIRRGIVNNYVKAKQLACQDRSVSRHENSSLSRASNKRRQTINTEFVRNYIENNSIDKRKRIDSPTFLTSFLEVRENVQDVLELNEGEIMTKDVFEVVAELIDHKSQRKKPKALGSMNETKVQKHVKNENNSKRESQRGSIARERKDTSLKHKSEIIPVKKQPVVTAAGVLADVEGYRKQVKKNMVQEVKIEFNERNKLRKLILANGSREAPNVKNFEKEMKDKSKQITSNLNEWKTGMSKLREILTINTDSHNNSPIKNYKDDLLHFSSQVQKESISQDDHPLAKLIETYQPQLQAQQLSYQKLAKRQEVRLNRAPLKIRTILQTTKHHTATNSLNVSPRMNFTKMAAQLESTSTAGLSSVSASRKAHAYVPKHHTFKSAGMIEIGGLFKAYEKQKTPRYVIKFQKKPQFEDDGVIKSRNLSMTLLKRQYMNKVADIYCKQIIEKRRVLQKLDEDEDS